MKNNASAPTVSTAGPRPTRQQARTLYAKIHLLDVVAHLNDLSQTLRQHGRTIDELGKIPTLTDPVIARLLSTLRQRDRQVARRLVKIRTNVNKANDLLLLEEPEPNAPN
jgi:hypothetical protein